MVTPVNDRDVLLQSAASRDVDPLAGKYIQLDMNATSFHVTASGSGSPSAITITGIPVNIVGGTLSFSATNGTLTGTGNSRTFAFSGMTADTATVTATITDMNGNTFSTVKTITKVYDGGTGKDGVIGSQYAIAYLYQFATTAPNKPTGTSTYNWQTGNNTVYTANDGWTVNVPTNNGNPLASLYVVGVPLTATGGTTSSGVSYTNAVVQAWAQNGANGSSGVQSATATIYQPSANTPTPPVGTATWNWANGTFDTVPSGWTLNPPTTLAAGYTLWAAKVSLVTSATNAQTPFNWNAATLSVAGYAGTNGVGQNGLAGASYVTAYCASATPTTTTAPAQTSGKNSYPVANDGGINGSWTKSVPVLSSGQYLYQSDGIYDPSTDKVTWSIPYWSSLKVGSLSAITGVMGRLTISDIISDAGNNWSIDATGLMTCKAFKLVDPSTGLVVLQAGGKLNSSYAPAGSLQFTAMPGGTFDFASTPDALGWYTENGGQFSFGSDWMTFASANNDPMIGHDFPAFSSSTYDKIRMKVRRTGTGTAWDGTVFWGSSTGAEGVEGSVAIPDTTVKGQFVILEWDMSKSPGWANKSISHLRIDLGASPNDVFDIDWIQVGRYGPANLASIGYTGDTNATYGANANNFTATIGGDNLARNSSFEIMSNGSLADGWSVYNNAGSNEPTSAYQAPGRTGGLAQGIVWSGNHNDTKGILGNIAAAWQAGRTYMVSFWAKTTNIAGNPNFSLYWNTAPASVVQVANPPLTGTDWHQYIFRITWGGSVEGDGRIFISVAPGSGAGNIIIDDLMVVEGDVAPSYYPSTAEVASAVTAIASDSILSKGEKSQAIQQWNAIDAEWAQLRAQANNLGVDYSAYDTAHQALSSYLVGLNPRWSDTTQDTPIDPTVWRSTWTNYTTYRQALSNAIAAKASAMSTWTGTAGRPADTDILNSYSQFGPNLIPNSDFSSGLAGWGIENTNRSVGWDYCNSARITMAGLGWAINGGVGEGSTVLQVHQPGDDGDNGASVNFEIYSPLIPVDTSKHYVFSAYTGAHRCKVDLLVAFYDVNGTYISTVYAPSNVNGPAGGQYLAGYMRQQAPFVPPSNAAAVRLIVYKWTTIAGKGDSWLMLARLMLQEVGGNTTVAGPWAPAGVSNQFAAQVADKLSQTAGGVLQGPVYLQSSGAFVSGSAAWTSSGYSGTGTVMSPNGFACVKNGVPTFAASVSGDVSFAGTLVGPIVQAANLNVASLDAITGRIGLLRTASSGQRSELSDSGLQIFNSAGLAVIQVGFF